MAVSFEEAMAMKQTAGAEAAPAPVSFEEAMALKQQATPLAGRFGGKKAMPKSSQYSAGEQMTDLARSAGGDLSEAAEFVMDTSQLLNPSDWGARHEAGMAATAAPEGEKRGVWDAVSAIPKYAYGFASANTDATKRIEQLLESDIYNEQIPQGEGSPILDIAKRGIGLAIDLGMTGFMGGGGKVKTAREMIEASTKQMLDPTLAKVVAGEGRYTVGEGAKTGASMVAGGTAGGEMFGDTGEIGGVVAGVLARDPKALASLIDMLGGAVGKIKGVGTGLKRSLIKSGDTLATASDSEIRSGMQEILRNLTMPDGSPMTVDRLNEVEVLLEAAVRNGKKGTLAQIIDDAGLRQMEITHAADPSAGGRAAQLKLDNIDSAINADAVGAVDDIAKGADASRASVFPRTIVAEQKKEIVDTARQPRVAALQARKAEEEARQTFADAPDTLEAGRALTRTTQTASDNSFNAVKKKWAELDKLDATIPAGDLQQGYKQSLRKELKGDDNLIRAFEKDFPLTVERINSLEGDVSLGALSNVISLLSKESRGTSSAPEVITAVKEALYKTIEKGSDLRKAAARDYRTHMETFGPKTQVGKALKQDEALAGELLIKPKAAGAVSLAKTIEATNSAKEAQDVLRDTFRKDAMKTGEIDPKAAAKFQSNYEQHLKLPGMETLRAEVEQAVSRADALRTTTKAAEAAEKEGKTALVALKQSPLGKYAASGETYDEAIAAARRSVSPKSGQDLLEGLTTLVDSTKGNKSAFDDIRRSFADDFFSKAFDPKGRLKSGSKVGGLTQFKRKRDLYEKSGMFTKQELDNIETQFTEAQKMFLGEDGKRLLDLPPRERRVQQAIAALVGAKVGAQAFGSPLIGAALGRKFATDQLSKMTDAKASKLAFELSTNPDKYLEWINKLKKPDASVAEIQRDMSGFIEAAMAGARIKATDGEDD